MGFIWHRCWNSAQYLVISDYFHKIIDQIWIESIDMVEDKDLKKLPKKMLFFPFFS